MLASIFDSLGTLGASLVVYALEIGIFIGASYVGVTVADRRRSSWQGWAAGIVSLLLLGAILFPSIDILKERACQHAEDHDACIDGDGGDDG